MKKKILISLSIVLAVMLTLLLSKIVKTDYSGFETIYPPNFNKKGISIYELLPDTSKTEDLYDNFPYEQYINNVNLTEINAINRNLKELNTITKSGFLSQNILSNALTQKANKLFTGSGLDTLNMILTWADGFKAYSNIDKSTASFYNSIYDYWYSYVVKELQQIIGENGNQKYAFKYRYLYQRCSNTGAEVIRGTSKFEKIILYIIDSKWSYLFERFWSGTGILFKLVFFSFLGLGIFISYQSIKCFFQRVKNKNINN